MFRIKICGVTNPEDAFIALEAGADAIGFNFYGKSRRHVDVTTASEITEAIYSAAGIRFHGLVYPVGVFVNHSAAIVNRICREARLVLAQLHGDEPPEFFGMLPYINAIRVRRLPSYNYESLGEDFRACRDAVLAAGSEFESPCAVLVDTASDQYGGTGEAVDWSALAGHSRWLGEAPLILAGGLTPDNVAEAIRVVRPHAVDVASGVESSPGKKDHTKVRDFVAAAREAFEQI